MNKNVKYNDKKHKYCYLCSKRLDKVKNMKYNCVQDFSLLKKIDLLKSGIKVGEYVCNRCSQSARIKYNHALDDSNSNSLINSTSNLVCENEFERKFK
jgi:hypothetical protein